MCKVADFGLYYHSFKYGHGNAKKVSNIVSLLHFKQLTVAPAELYLFKVNMQISGCRLSPQGCVPVKWTAPEVLYGNIANLCSKSDVYVLLWIKLQLYFFLVKAQYLCEKLLEKAFSLYFLGWHGVCKKFLRLIQPDPSICDLKLE